jgi:hypothetical protein
MTRDWWATTTGHGLAQGDLLPDCLAPVFSEGPAPGGSQDPTELTVLRARLIVVTQSCDLENDKVDFVALCPAHTLLEFEQVNPEFARKGRWEEVRKGRVEGLHLLASPTDPANNRAAYSVDFGHIISLPFAYLSQHAAALGPRWRLNSPFLEHFSQAFARFFMRVGLPGAISSYK